MLVMEFAVSLASAMANRGGEEAEGCGCDDVGEWEQGGEGGSEARLEKREAAGEIGISLILAVWKGRGASVALKSYPVQIARKVLQQLWW